MSKSLRLTLTLAAAFITFSSLSNAQLCSNLSLKGSFGYSVSGSVIKADPFFISGPFAAVGKIKFDGAGHVSTVRTLSDNGTVVQNDTGSGTYTVKNDCTGSFSISVMTPAGNTTLNLDIVLDDIGQLRGIVTNPGLVLLFEGQRQPLLSF